MKKSICLIFAVILLSACGGGGEGKSLGSNVKLGIAWPAALAELDRASYKLYGSLSRGDEIIQSEVTGEDQDEGYLFKFDSVSEGEALFKVSFKYVTLTGEFRVAEAQGDVNILQPDTEVFFAEDNFTDIGGDDPDEDQLNNLSEILLGTDPMNSDTDGDGVIDSLDMFPALSAEWSDTDGDGIGDNEDKDIDGDGIDNETELKIGTDPYKLDTDGDGIGDGDDICKLVANPSQKDTDGDGRGDECDDDSDGDGLTDKQELALGTDSLKTDTDGDGVSDKIENDFGTNPLKKDTDGDGYGDKEDKFPLDSFEWADVDNDGFGDNSDNCPDVPNSDQKNTDHELSLLGYSVNPDALGDECDDDIDGDGLKIVFADAQRGSDENLGTFNAPVKSIRQAIVVAYRRNEGVYAAGGEYDVSDAVFKADVNLFGGFDGQTFDTLQNLRDIRSSDAKYCTYLKNNSSAVSLNINSSHGLFILEGFYVTNETDAEHSEVVKLYDSTVVLKGNKILGNAKANYSTAVLVEQGSPLIDANWLDGKGRKDATKSRGLYIANSSPMIKNNIVLGGRARHSAAVEVKNSATLIVNNTLDGTSRGSSPATASGLIFDDSSPRVVNNVIVAEPKAGDSIAMKCFGVSPSSSEFRNNVLSTFTSGTSDALVVDCDGTFHYAANFTVGASPVSGNIAYNGNFSSLLNASYALAGSTGVNAGLFSGSAEYGSVTKDYTFAERTGVYDTGAIEK